jgi:hypothetical protein
MYPPKIIGLIGFPLLAASIATWMLPAGAASAFLPCLNTAVPATEAFRSSRRFIGMLSLLELMRISPRCLYSGSDAANVSVFREARSSTTDVPFSEFAASLDNHTVRYF